jgi:hypothetical protein
MNRISEWRPEGKREGLQLKGCQGRTLVNARGVERRGSVISEPATVSISACVARA